jgi:hypothetical protein
MRHPARRSALERLGPFSHMNRAIIPQRCGGNNRWHATIRERFLCFVVSLCQSCRD